MHASCSHFPISIPIALVLTCSLNSGIQINAEHLQRCLIGDSHTTYKAKLVIPLCSLQFSSPSVVSKMAITLHPGVTLRSFLFLTSEKQSISKPSWQHFHSLSSIRWLPIFFASTFLVQATTISHLSYTISLLAGGVLSLLTAFYAFSIKKIQDNTQKRKIRCPP